MSKSNSLVVLGALSALAVSSGVSAEDAKRLVGNDAIVVLTAHLFPFENASFFQVRNDSLHGPLGDSDLNSHLAKHCRRVP